MHLLYTPLHALCAVRLAQVTMHFFTCLVCEKAAQSICPCTSLRALQRIVITRLVAIAPTLLVCLLLNDKDVDPD